MAKENAKQVRARVKERMETVTVKVIADKFGTYKKGDEIDMHPSTAKAIAGQKDPAIEILTKKK